MKGEYEWRWRWFGRVGGPRDLFGNMNLQDPGGTLVGLAGPNIYPQSNPTPNFNSSNMRIVRGGFSASGSDAHMDEQRATFFPSFMINPAVSFHSVMTIGGYRNKYAQSANGVGIPPFERYYTDRTSLNAFDTAAILSVEQWKVLWHLPWGTLSLGMKDFPIGTGATLAKNTRASAFFISVPYGPFTFLPGIWTSRTRFSEGWNTGPDGAKKNTSYPSLGIMYRSGAIEFGWLGAWRIYSANAYESPFFRTVGDTTEKAPFDDYTDLEVLYMKYSNGRFFFNAEYGMLNVDRRLVGRGPSYSICRHFFVELGAMAGPTKISLMGAGTTGFAHNNPNKTITCVPMSINYQALQPFESLMFNAYAGGNNGGWTSLSIPLTSDENGQMADAFGFGARLDYAVAANLNVWGSYLWAHRTEQNGTLAGGTASTGGVGNTTAAAAQAWKQLNTGFAGLNPYVDNGFIGWEVDLGVDWKILENTVMTFRWAYWQPGEWFDQAYQAVTLRSGAVVTDGMLIGRDPITHFRGGVEVAF